MKKIRYKLERAVVGNFTDVAFVHDGKGEIEVVVEPIAQTLMTALPVTIAGVTMHLAAWTDPDHWEDEWRGECGDQEPGAYVAGLLAQARED